jgi:hypothetical protein
MITGRSDDSPKRAEGVRRCATIMMLASQPTKARTLGLGSLSPPLGGDGALDGVHDAVAVP